MKKLILYLFIGVLFIGLYSCEMFDKLDDPKDPEVENSAIFPLSGEWYVTARWNDGVADQEYGYYKLLTFGTVANTTDSMWVTDYHNGAAYNNWFWQFKSKTAVNVSGLTFGNVNPTVDSYHGIDVTISNGKVILNGGKSTSGVVTDSIYFDVEYSDDPGVIYSISGVRRTGFLEDEH